MTQRSCHAGPASLPLISCYDGSRKGRRIPVEAHKRRANSEIIFGVHPVHLALLTRQRDIYQLHMRHSLFHRDRAVLKGQNAALAEILSLAELSGVPKHLSGKDFLDALCHGRPHQGVALECSALPMPWLNEDGVDRLAKAKDGRPAMVVFFDEVKDVMNFSSMLRSICFFAVEHVVLPAAASCAPLPLVSKISSGAMEVLRFHRVDNKTQLLEQLKARGWFLIGTSGNPLPNLRCIEAFEATFYADCCPPDRPLLVIFGSEDRGVAEELLALCDVVLRIPGASVHASMPSLNVSVSTGITLHVLHQAREKHGR